MIKPARFWVPALIMASAGVGCGTLIEGDGARLDHWGPLPVVCLGQCSVLDPYYYDKQDPTTSDGESATDTTAADTTEDSGDPAAETMAAPTDTASQTTEDSADKADIGPAG